MRLLIVTQKVDRNDPILGFFHRWIEEFAKHCESVLVIALGVGEYDLPENVKVLSLGKEGGQSRLKYLWRFYKYIWEERKNYDKVFVHMNQEYVLLAGDMWRLMGKKVYMWRNHAKGDILTMMAVWIAHKVFYTSPQSFTVKFRKSVRMPVGIDTNFFKPDPSVVRESNSILFLGRIAPVKKVLEFVEWLKTQDFDSCTIAGSALAKDLDYEKKVKDRVVELELSDQVKFVGSVNQIEARRLYQTHETYVNFTPVGSLDKTIFEAKACGAKVEVKNSDYEKLSNEDHGLKSLLDKFMVEIK